MMDNQINEGRMKDILRLAETAAGTKSSVLIQGENGSGKTYIAKLIHEKSARAAAPFVTVNCAQQPEMLLETELFGFEKGAFAGTVSEKRGKFELASGGTIVLDNITELTARLQAKLLKMIESGLAERIGSKAGIPVDVRIIAISARNANESVSAGRFLEPLFYKVNSIQIMVPPLRERREDMASIVASMLTKITLRTGIKVAGIAEDAIEKLKTHDFQGNLRELEGILERAANNALDGTIRASEIIVGNVAFNVNQGAGAHSADWEVLARWAPGRTLDDIEKAVILRALDHNNGNRTHTARELGISIRTLRNKLNIYRREGIEV